MSQRRFLSVIAVSAVAMAGIFGAMQPSFAEDDEPNFMSKLFGAVGLLQLPGPQIDFQERPPLVVPPISPYVQPVVRPRPRPPISRTPGTSKISLRPKRSPIFTNQRPPQHGAHSSPSGRAELRASAQSGFPD